MPYMSTYGAQKAAIESYTRSWACHRPSSWLWQFVRYQLTGSR